jgi:hypothetical protein
MTRGDPRTASVRLAILSRSPAIEGPDPVTSVEMAVGSESDVASGSEERSGAVDGGVRDGRRTGGSD